MLAEDENKKDVKDVKEVEADEVYDDFDYDKYLDDDFEDDDDETVDSQVKQDTKQSDEKKQEKVGIEDPKEGIKFEPSLENITIILSLVGIALVCLSRMFASIPLAICFTIFYWLGAAVVIGAIAIYATQIIQAKKVKFEPQLVILILAIICSI